MGKFLAILLVGCAVLAGGGMYYLQVYHYYDEVVSIPGTDVALTPQGSSEAEPVSYDNFQGIDADSSPIRYRACFTTSLSHATLDKTYRSYKPAEPRVAPGWFDCFDATEVGEALESGEAKAYLGTENVQYGIDRVVAIHEDGRGFVWHQINRCGEIVFDGQPAPDDCPTPPEGY